MSPPALGTMVGLPSAPPRTEETSRPFPPDDDDDSFPPFLFLCLGLDVTGTTAVPPPSTSTALTTFPPEEPPQAARDPIGVSEARSFRSMMTGCPPSIRIFCPM